MVYSSLNAKQSFSGDVSQRIQALTWQPGNTANTSDLDETAISCHLSEDLKRSTGTSASVIICHREAQKNRYLFPSGAIVQFRTVINPGTESSGDFLLFNINT